MVWYLLGFLVFTYLINKLALYHGYTNLTYRMKLDKRVYEIGEEIEITSIVENKKPLSVSFLEVHEKFSLDFSITSNVYSLFILPNQRVKRTYKITPNKRGLHLFEDVHLKLGDFIGLESEVRHFQQDKELIVLPEKLDLQEAIAPMGALNGDVSVKRWILEDPLMMMGIREYTGNEPQRFIHWPSSAKYNQLMVKNFDFTTDSSVNVVLNIETMKPSWKSPEEDIIEKAICLARSVVEELEEEKIPYGFATNAFNERPENRGYYIHPGLGQHHLDSCLEVMGKLDFRIPTFFENTLRDMRKRKANYSTVVIITPRILDTYIEPINLLSKAVSRTVVITIEDQHLADLNNNILKYRSR